MKFATLNSMNVILNGTPIEVPDDFTLSQLIEQQGMAGKRLAAEVNLEIIPRAQHSSCKLGNDDKIEIVHAIGGG